MLKRERIHNNIRLTVKKMLIELLTQESETQIYPSSISSYYLHFTNVGKCFSLPISPYPTHSPTMSPRLEARKRGPSYSKYKQPSEIFPSFAFRYLRRPYRLFLQPCSLDFSRICLAFPVMVSGRWFGLYFVSQTSICRYGVFTLLQRRSLS